MQRTDKCAEGHRLQVNADNTALSAVTLTYTAVSFICAIALSPIFTALMVKHRMEYVPTAFDYLLSFVIYSIIIIISLLPGFKRISSATYANGGAI